MGLRKIFCTVNFPAFGCMEGRLVLEGTETVMGIPLDAVPPRGPDFFQKRAWLQACSKEDLLTLVRENGWCVAHNNSQCPIVPSGFICVYFCAEKTKLIRWGISSDGRDTERVQVALNMQIEAFTGIAQCLVRLLGISSVLVRVSAICV